MKHKLLGLPVFILIGLVAVTATAEQTAASVVAASGADAAAMVAEGNRLWEAGDIDAAIVRFEAAADADPRSMDARMKLGGALLAKNDFSAAVKAFQQAIGIEPENAKGFIALGIAYMHGSNDGPAYAAFEEAIRLDPSRADDLRPVMARIEERGGRSGRGAPHPSTGSRPSMGLGSIRP